MLATGMNCSPASRSCRGSRVTSCSSGRIGRPPRRSTLDARERYCFRRNRSKSKALSTRVDPVPAVECGPATIRSRRRMPPTHGEVPTGRRETRSASGPPPTLDRPFPASPERGAFARSSSRDCTCNVVRRGPTSTARKPTELRSRSGRGASARLRRQSSGGSMSDDCR
jgi:hypothetical protein